LPGLPEPITDGWLFMRQALSDFRHFPPHAPRKGPLAAIKELFDRGYDEVHLEPDQLVCKAR
jgi:hypothetical protein